MIDPIPKLMSDEKNIEDAQKEGHELFLDVCESFRYGVTSDVEPEHQQFPMDGQLISREEIQSGLWPDTT